jgi:hypothetical protein
MPFDNQTRSETGALFLRKEMHKNLERKGYIGIPLSQVDEVLANQFPDLSGRQITMARIPAIGKALRVDAVMTGTVQKFGEIRRAPLPRRRWKQHLFSVRLERARYSGNTTDLLLG